MRISVVTLLLAVLVSTVMARDPVPVSGTSATVIEAEEYNRKRSKQQHDWERVRGQRADIPDHIRGLPSDNTVFDLNRKDFEKKTPSVEYDVDFEKPGTYYLWCRGKGEAGGSAFAFGVDKKLLRTDFIGFFPYEFAWHNTYYNGDIVTMNIKKKGEHRLHFWIIEDGVCLDKFIITPDAEFKPKEN